MTALDVKGSGFGHDWSWLIGLCLSVAVHIGPGVLLWSAMSEDVDSALFGAIDVELPALALVAPSGETDPAATAEIERAATPAPEPEEPEKVEPPEEPPVAQQPVQPPVAEPQPIEAPTPPPEVAHASIPEPEEMPKSRVEPVQQPQPANDRRQRKHKEQAKSSRRGGERTAALNGSAGLRASGGGGGEADLANFKGRVRARVASRARAARERGIVVVRFIVTAGGGATGIGIVRGASPSLNNAALRAVSGGFPPIPPGLPRAISFTVPISFQ